MLGAANDNALCQMALAYRHLIGADGLHQDCDVAIGNLLFSQYFIPSRYNMHHISFVEGCASLVFLTRIMSYVEDITWPHGHAKFHFE